MRRIAAMAGLVVLIVLAIALLWRVYRHHHAADPYDLEQPAMVQLDESAKSRVRIAHDLR
ncbi:MAG: hypothetical protein ACTHQM_11025 [Thermoanaerobaculia bacterium]